MAPLMSVQPIAFCALLTSRVLCEVVAVPMALQVSESGLEQAVVGDSECVNGDTTAQFESDCAFNALQQGSRKVMLQGRSAGEHPNPTPSFSAAVILQPCEGGCDQGLWRDVTMVHDAESKSWFLEAFPTHYDYISVAYEYMWTRFFCIDGKCSLSYNNGTLCTEDMFFQQFQQFFLLHKPLLERGTRQSSGSVEGQACDNWALNDTVQGYLEACIAADGLWLSTYFRPLGDTVGPTNVGIFTQNLTFKINTVGSAIPPIEPVICPPKSPKFCPSKGTVKRQVFRATDFIDDGELGNKDTTDAIGRTVTLGPPSAVEFLFHKFYEVYDVEYNSALGPWRDANFENGKAHIAPSEVNSSDFKKAVARGSTEGLEGELGSMGQCSENALAGSWFTFPEDGKCGPGQKVGDAGCTWRSTAFKAISMECMIWYNSTKMDPGSNLTDLFLKQNIKHSGYDDAWALDYRMPPFPNVQRHIDNAFKACPDVTGSE